MKRGWRIIRNVDIYVNFGIYVYWLFNIVNFVILVYL